MQYIPDYLKAIYDESPGKPDYEKLILTARKALTTHPQDKDCLNAFVSIYLNCLKKHTECIAHCRTVMPDMKDKECHQDVHEALFLALKNTEQLNEAIEVKKEMMAHGEYSGFAIKDLIEIYQKLNDKDNMVKYYELMVAENDADFEDMRELADLYDEKKDYANSIKYYEMAARENPQEGYWMWCNVGRALAITSQTDEAMFYFKMSAKLDTAYHWPYYYMGMVQQNKNDVFMALHYYNEALKRKPGFPEVENNLAAIKFHEDSDIKGAIKHIEKALEMKPEKQLLNIMYINLSRMYNKIGDYDMHEFYKGKLLELLGFPDESDNGDDEDDSD